MSAARVYVEDETLVWAPGEVQSSEGRVCSILVKRPGEGVALDGCEGVVERVTLGEAYEDASALPLQNVGADADVEDLVSLDRLHEASRFRAGTDGALSWTSERLREIQRKESQTTSDGPDVARPREERRPRGPSLRRTSRATKKSA